MRRLVLIACFAVIAYSAVSVCLQLAGADSAHAGQPAGKLLDEQLTAEMKQGLAEPGQGQMPLLVRLSRNASPEVRTKALAAMAGLELTAGATTAIIARAADSEPDVRTQAAYQMLYFRIATPDAIAAAKRLLLDKNPKVQNQAILYAHSVQRNARPLTPELLMIIAAGKSDNCRIAINALKDIGPTPAAVSVLEAAYEHYPDNALYALAQIQPSPTYLLPWLNRILSNAGNARTQDAAAWAIARYGDESRLIEAAGSSDLVIKSAAISAMAALPRPSTKVNSLLVAGMDHKSHDVRRRAAEAAGMIPTVDDDLLGAIARRFADADTSVRRVSRKSLKIQFKAELVDAARMNRVLDKAIAATPKARGLHFARAIVVHPIVFELLHAGENAKALRLLNKTTVGLIHTALKGNYKLAAFEEREVSIFLYNGACAACRCNQIAVGMKYLTASLENGWSDMKHLEHDIDIEPLRKLPAYHALMLKHHQQ